MSLVKAKCSPSVKCKRGDTPLHRACARDAQQAVQALVGLNEVNEHDKKLQQEQQQQQVPNNINLDTVNSWNETPLHTAAGAGFLTIVKTLIASKASLNPVDKWGRTPLQVTSSILKKK